MWSSHGGKQNRWPETLGLTCKAVPCVPSIPRTNWYTSVRDEARLRGARGVSSHRTRDAALRLCFQWYQCKQQWKHWFSGVLGNCLKDGCFRLALPASSVQWSVRYTALDVVKLYAPSAFKRKELSAKLSKIKERAKSVRKPYLLFVGI